MKILNRDFIGPLELEYHNLPKEYGVYVLAYIEKDKIKPIYIGFTRDLKHRINSLLIHNPIPKEILKDSEVKLFYSLFDQENYLQGQAFEIELIKKFYLHTTLTTINISNKANPQTTKLKEQGNFQVLLLTLHH